MASGENAERVKQNGKPAKKKKRKARKVSSRPRPGSNPATRLRNLDPVQQAKMQEGRRRARAAGRIMTRVGVPDGMRKEEAEQHWARARVLADKFIKVMEQKNVVEEVVVPDSEEAMAKEALREAFVMAVSPLEAKSKIAAINTVLNFTKAKPESKSKLTINKAEDWLAEVAQDMKQDG